MRRPRILFAAPSAYTLSGLAVWLDYLLPGLAGLGWDPVLALTSGRHHDAAEYLRLHPCERAVCVTNPSGSREGRARAFESVVEGVDADIVVSVNTPDVVLALERLRKRSTRYRRTVMAVHGFVPEIFDDAAEFAGVVDGLACTNRLGCELAREYAGLERARVHYTPCGTVLQKAWAKTPGNLSPLRLGFIGRLDQSEKRVYDSLQIVAEVIQRDLDCELVLVGCGPEEAGVRRKIAEYGLAGKIKLTGYLSREELSRTVYPIIDALLVTSPSETGPLAAWEAMAHGVPVVSSRYLGSGCESALVHRHNALLFPVGEIAQAATCVMELRNPELRDQLIRNGRCLVKQRYTIERSVQSWHQALSRVLEAPPLPAPKGTRLVPPAGRLDRALGVGWAESVRRAMRIRFEHQDPGGEWPHAYGRPSPNKTLFWELARTLDIPSDERGVAQGRRSCPGQSAHHGDKETGWQAFRS
jgi:glycosyltransferase involved in cell wall biosynthesis